MMQTDEEAKEEKSDRSRCDPCINVSDLELAFEGYFVQVGNRDLGGLLSRMKRDSVTWKTAPKVSHVFQVPFQGIGLICVSLTVSKFSFRSSIHVALLHICALCFCEGSDGGCNQVASLFCVVMCLQSTHMGWQCVSHAHVSTKLYNVQLQRTWNTIRVSHFSR